jgi:hypothetical protein
MRIYIAGFFTTSYGSEYGRISRASKPAWLLESYHYLKNTKRMDYIKEGGYTIFLDSGAFTMFTKGVTVDLKEYADFMDKHQDIIHVSSSLDCIGRDREQESYDNLKKLESYGAKVCPVHHARDSDAWLLRYLEEGYEYIFLGGMVPESTEYLRFWLDRIWKKYLMNKDGTPKVKVHGFGLTVIELMARYPWFSVDSTSWLMTSRFGSIYYEVPNSTRVLKVTISDKSPRVKDRDQHFDTLSPFVQASVIKQIEERGYTAQALRENYGYRDRWNIDFFRRFQERPADISWLKQEGLFGA